MLPAIVIGCGPSAQPVEYCPDRYKLCAVNDAVRLCERVDVLAINDTPAMMRIGDQWEKVGTILTPRYMHDDISGKRGTFCMDAMRNAGFKRGPGQEHKMYVLHTDPLNAAVATFGRCRSTSDSLIAWLLSQGVRRFFTTGIEWDGREGTHPDLTPGIHKTREHRLAIWEHTLERVRAHGATITEGLP